jgi:hypothetical protein
MENKMKNFHIAGTSGGEALEACEALFERGASAADVACAYALWL